MKFDTNWWTSWIMKVQNIGRKNAKKRHISAKSKFYKKIFCQNSLYRGKSCEKAIARILEAWKCFLDPFRKIDVCIEAKIENFEIPPSKLYIFLCNFMQGIDSALLKFQNLENASLTLIQGNKYVYWNENPACTVPSKNLDWP